MRILLSGINGFVGKHVTDRLHEMGHEVIGVGSQELLNASLKVKVSAYYSVDLTDAKRVQSLDLRRVDAIINLAGLAKVGESIGQAELYNKINVGTHKTLYQECLRQGVSPRIIAVSSGAVYDPRQPMPITEDSALVDDASTNEYTISKKLMETSVLSLNKLGLDCIIVRPFNHSGPGQLPGFLIPDLGEQILACKQSGLAMRVGNLHTRRDYTDVRDVAYAYALLATVVRTKLNHAVYNVCSSKSTPGTEVLELLAQSLGLKNLRTEIDPQKIRPHDVMDIYGSYERLHCDTGWKPEITVAKMLQDFANWKLDQVIRK